MLSAVAELGDCARAVAVINPATDDGALLALADRGVRAVRAFMLFDPIYSWRELEPLSARIAQFGWLGGEKALRGEIESQRRGARAAGIFFEIAQPQFAILQCFNAAA